MKKIVLFLVVLFFGLGISACDKEDDDGNGGVCMQEDKREKPT